MLTNVKYLEYDATASDIFLKKKTSEYYTQVQIAMYCTNTSLCHFLYTHENNKFILK